MRELIHQYGAWIVVNDRVVEVSKLPDGDVIWIGRRNYGSHVPSILPGSGA